MRKVCVSEVYVREEARKVEDWGGFGRAGTEEDYLVSVRWIFRYRYYFTR